MVAFRSDHLPPAFEVFLRQREAKPTRGADEQEFPAGRMRRHVRYPYVIRAAGHRGIGGGEPRPRMSPWFVPRRSVALAASGNLAGGALEDGDHALGFGLVPFRDAH